MSSYLRHCSSRLPGKTCSRERNNFPLRLSGGISGEGIHPGFPIRMVQYAALALSTCCFSARDMDIDAPRGVSFLGIKWLAANQTRGIWDGNFVGRENLGTNAKKKWSEQKGSIQGRQYLLFLPQTLTISVTLLKLCNRYSGPTSLRCFLSPYSRDEDEERQEPTNDYSVFFFLFMLLLPFSHERTFLRRIFLYIIQNIFSKLLNLLIDLNRPSGNKTL
ncbi:CRE_HP_G0052890.mRNA.1.CDS.1 [Saccharomyces cerevisiae]|nr:CRE_HP_G0028920.mRNA.1.CDS.1 [Saccharomyces cerevisiae]CAI4945532.1 CRE_HP_G0033110.mRNA.1.CDS.1 [Saccharomyces cerevisiae]CAI4974022.1 CRE_HP_G0052890.mRNA.1.CDS.1 [Saccharomyces cerevisiae]CAI6530178.1 CRE_HP_G0028920.mRNA.1.CDS.1 [Saccharomyces cerevisiae]CAI6576857.1 CRE_HP_G0033110.mRNA.1.CDS.1 [Saccharomyces cerevisiae]